MDLPAMGYNTARYVHTLYQVMNLAFADRDFYYGDPDFPPEEPIRGLLSKDYARSTIRADRLVPQQPRHCGRAIPIRSKAGPTRSCII
jgi:gamma-glutamyltranspeptidase / glutathione hydrolase